MATRFWLIRHALVTPDAQAILYGTLDVDLCTITMDAQQGRYAALAKRLPKNAVWVVSPLSRTQLTAETIIAAGYGEARPSIEPSLIEQDFGTWQGLPMRDILSRPAHAAHPFWPVGAGETPPDGEAFEAMITRVGVALERLAEAYPDKDIIAVSHGGAIRAAIAYALDLSPHQALCLAVDNLSVSRIERHAPAAGTAWRFVSLNEQLST
jgi:alpha-ribazole phosphatase